MTSADPAFAEDPAVHEATAARCRIYAHFASVLGHPDHDIHSVLVTGQWFDQLRHLSTELPFKLDAAAFQDVIDVPQIEELTSLYTSQFEVGIGSISLFGRTYEGREGKPVFEDLFRVYEHFGLKFDEGLPEWPDWIVVELEFMHYLTFLEAGSPGDVASLQRGERDFLDKHLMTFTQGLAQSLEDKAVPVYREISRQLAAVVAADATYLRALVCSEQRGA